MRVQLKGINRITKKLVSGQTITYFYAWKGGPRLEGTPGSPEFHASYNAAVASRRAMPKDQLRAILDKFERSSDFLDLAEKTRKDYKNISARLRRNLGTYRLPRWRTAG